MPDLDDAGDQVVNARWLLQSRSTRYRGGLPDGDVHVLIDGRDEVTMTFDAERCRLRYGHTDVEPLLAIEGSSHDLVALLRRPIDDDDPRTAGDVRVIGDPDLFDALVSALQI